VWAPVVRCLLDSELDVQCRDYGRAACCRCALARHSGRTAGPPFGQAGRRPRLAVEKRLPTRRARRGRHELAGGSRPRGPTTSRRGSSRSRRPRTCAAAASEQRAHLCTRGDTGRGRGSVLASLATADEETDEGVGDEVEERPHRPIVPGPSERESGFPIPTLGTIDPVASRDHWVVAGSGRCQTARSAVSVVGRRAGDGPPPRPTPRDRR
jgi:hypothetical protein